MFKVGDKVIDLYANYGLGEIVQIGGKCDDLFSVFFYDRNKPDLTKYQNSYIRESIDLKKANSFLIRERLGVK